MNKFLSFDTRRLIIPERTIFFALQGEQKNGHDFIKKAYQQGVREFVVQRGFDYSAFANSRFVEVDDVLAYLQKVALEHRQQFDLQTIGITGSNGKTIVKEWLNYLLSKKNPTKVVCNPKSYNSQIGVPLSVWEIRKQHKIGIFEAGISTVGEMKNLAPLIDCEIGIFTNIGSAHDEGFDNRTQKVAEKAILFQNAKMIIYNSDFEIIDTIIRQKYAHKKLVTWSFQKETSDLIITKITHQRLTKIEGVFNNEKVFIEIPYSDKASIENAINCWLTMLTLGYVTNDLHDDFRQLPHIALRLELKPAVNNSTLIDDSYSLDLNSLTIALDFLIQQQTNAKRTLILSDILQSGLAKADLYQMVATRLNRKKINRLIGIGTEIQAIKPFLDSTIETKFYKSTASFLRNFKSTNFQNESILLKGARIFEFERIAKALERQLHQAVLEVNLNALADNLRVYRSFVKPTTKIMAMVKASAYGSGIGEVARFLEYQNVDYLGVAYTDEGIVIRNAGVRLPILVLNPDIGTFEKLILNRLEPEIYSFELLDSFLQSLENTRQLYPDLDLNNYPIHIKLDTGMRRLGFELNDLELLQKRLEKLDNVRIKSMFSHLAGSDATIHDAFTEHQISTFQAMCQTLFKILTYKPLQHILNSSGITRFPNAQMNMVRLGIGLYGIDAQPIIQRKLQNVSTLKTTISQIKYVKKGETIGYNRVGEATKNIKTATIGIGYADGFGRALSDGVGEVFLHGQTAKVIGNVCMDMTMIDITAIEAAQVGDEVEIFGEHLTVQSLAKRLKTIPYEVFTNISERVKRVYFQE
ncbi:MAG: bifunctional UDP-N-acetylmuramoyl-tripeptide:D-alanyl-D-alanine ligase/alanine racemase [Saprospiraceae bacterium]